MSHLVAFTEGERVAIIAGLLAIVAGVPGAIAAIITARTRKENTDQHGESQRKLDEVRDAVTGQTVKIDEVRSDVQGLGVKVDQHSDLLARHDERLNKATGTLDMTRPTDSHPIL